MYLCELSAHGAYLDFYKHRIILRLLKRKTFHMSSMYNFCIETIMYTSNHKCVNVGRCFNSKNLCP